MLKKLSHADDRYREIEQMLTLPEVIANNKEYQKLIKEYNKLEDVVMFEDNGVLRVENKKSQPPESGIKLINKDTGLIGNVEPDQYGIKLKCLIDASLQCGDWIQTESVILPGTNGKYKIYTLDFDFASREQQFYCNIYAKAANIG